MCSSVFGDCDITSQRCCGRNNIYPVYINTELQGCYTPLIPGFKRLLSDPLYECDDIPDALTGPPSVLEQPDYDPALIIEGDTALIRQPTVAVPGGHTFFLYGCFGLPPLGGGLDGIVNGVFNGLLSILLPDFNTHTLESCAAGCDALGFNAFGMVNGE